MSLSRRAIVIGTGALAAGMPNLAAAQLKPTSTAAAGSATAATGRAEFSLKYANNLPASHPLNVRAREMAAAIRTESKGRVELQIFPNNELGNDTEMLRKLKAGEIDFFTLSGLILSTTVPAAAITGLGFAFPNYDAVWSAVDGELGTYIRSQIVKHDLVVMEKVWDNGFRQITSSSKAITSSDDLRGMKIRVPMSPMWTSMFKALEASPTGINFGEVYPALQSKSVEGQENPLAVIDAAKLYEVQKFCSLTYHMWDGFWFLGNKKSWERLPEDLRGIVSKRANVAATVQRTDVAILNAVLQKDLAAKGMVFNKPSPDTFRNSMRKSGFYAEWKEKFGPEAWSKLERYTGKLL
jgi:TRAP-type transport system periplasmic protein